MNTTNSISGFDPSPYKLQESWTTFAANSFPIRRLLRSSANNEQAWLTAYQAESKKYFEAVLTNQRLDQINREQIEKEKRNIPKRKTLKKSPFLKNDLRDPRLLDGFYLLELTCIDDPLDLASLDISNKELSFIKDEDMALFDNLVEIKANENKMSFESFKCFVNLKKLYLACNNLKCLRIKHEEFLSLEFLDLSYNSLNPNDIAHLGLLVNLKYLKLTGNNLSYLPDTFSKLYVYTKDNKKLITERFPMLEELYLDHNNLKEEDSFDVLAVLKRLKRLHLNSNSITCIPNLKVFRKNLVFQEFNKSYYKRKLKRPNTNSARNRRSIDLKINETIAKDLERSNSELNIHASNLFRNSFIIEENEDEIKKEKLSPTFEDENNLTNNSVESFDKTYDLPFSELNFIDLSDNKIEEEDDLIGLASWPMLNEIIIYGNPIVYNNVGFPPIIKEYLIDRLGISIHRIRPLKPLKVPIVLPNREHRVIDSIVPKIPKFPVEMKMLTFYQQNDENENESSSRSNISSAKSYEKSLEKKRHSPESIDTVGHNRNKNENLFKPFKKDQQNENLFKSESHVMFTSRKEQDNTSQKLKENSSFFMTQFDHEDGIKQETKLSSSTHEKKNQKKDKKIKEKTRINDDYEILYDIEDEDQIKIPKDINGSIRALKQLLDNPLVFRETCTDLNKPNNYKPKENTEKSTQSVPKQVKPRVKEINEMLDSIKERKVVRELSLTEAISEENPNKMEVENAKKMFIRAQQKYEQIKKESLKTTVN